MTRIGLLSICVFFQIGVGCSPDDGGVERVTLDDYTYEFLPDPERFSEQVAKLLSEDAELRQKPGGIICIGSSTMRMWKDRMGEDLAGLSVVPFGFGGSHFTDAIYYAQRLIVDYQPRAILVYEGDNDTNRGKSPERVRDDLVFFIDYCRSSLPDLRVYVISIKPAIARSAIWDSVVVPTNDLIEAYCDESKGVTYIDISEGMFDGNRVLRPELFRPDGVHLTDAGYDVWAAAIAPALKNGELGQEPPTP